MEEDKIIIYQAPDGETSVDIRLENETEWLAQIEMAKLFQKDRFVIRRHICSVYKEGKLDRNITCARFARMDTDENRQYETTIVSVC